MISTENKSKARNNKSVTGFIKKNKKYFTAFLSLIFSLGVWLLIWHIASVRIGISFILPSPAEAFTEFFKLLPQKSFISAVTGSLLRVIFGFLLGTAVGCVLAFASYFFTPFRAFLSPIVKVVRATPVASFILICVLWMPTAFVPVFIAFLMVLPIVYLNLLTGLDETDARLCEVAKLYKFSPAKKLIYLYIPSALPYLASASTTSLGLAWKSCVSAEVLTVCANSLGYHIYVSKQYFETEELFAWTIAIIILSVMLEYAVKGCSLLIKHLTSRNHGGIENGK